MEMEGISCLLFGILLRWIVASYPYSGEGKPPMFGDYEAQRHWMEVTVNLPREEWYVDSERNDLQYWGLDYPPLTAFHSYVLGHFFAAYNPDSIEYYGSRGYENAIHKFWMRASVFFSDLLIPGLCLFFYFFYQRARERFPYWAVVGLALVAPPFILIDYGHFQYNGVSLGLTVLGILCVGKEWMSFGAFFFTLAINHKQMSLYHSIPFFIQMSSVVLLRNRDFLTAFRVLITIGSTMGLLWLPFGNLETPQGWWDIIGRIFPLKRGVYEDKVGSFWYVLDRFLGFKNAIPDEEQARLCIFVTVVILLPGAFDHLVYASRKKNPEQADRNLEKFLLNLLNVSLIFFLFSYHVHEKSILLPVLPAILLFPIYPFSTTWFISISSFSLYPLLYEEGSHPALLFTVGIFLLFAYQIGAFQHRISLVKFLFISSLLTYLFLIFGLHFIRPPTKLPHLWQSLIAILSFAHYGCFSIWFHWIQFEAGEGADPSHHHHYHHHHQQPKESEDERKNIKVD